MAEEPALTEPTPSPENPTTPDDPVATRPVVNDGGDASDKNFNHWWDWVKGKLDGAKDWANGLMDKVKGGNDSSDDT